jgi:hypothetical protein
MSTSYIMAASYRPFLNLPPLDLAKLVVDLRELARMRAIEGEHPKVGTRQQAKAIADTVKQYVLYVQVPREQQSLDHMLHCIADACRVTALSEPEQRMEFGTCIEPASGDEFGRFAERLAEVAGVGDAGDDSQVLTKEAAGVLVHIAKRPSETFSIDDITLNVDRCQSRTTAKRAIDQLINLKFADRPKGPKKGVAVTRTGLAFANKLGTKSDHT